MRLRQRQAGRCGLGRVSAGSPRPDEGGVHMLPQNSERGLLWSYEGPLEAMSQYRTQRGGPAAAGSTSDDGEVRIGLIDSVL